MFGTSRINCLSETFSPCERDGSAVVMVGSYAPVHRGHFDAVKAASSAVVKLVGKVEAVVLAPNSGKYVEGKLGDEGVSWSYEHRIRRILCAELPFALPTFVDDISGREAGTRQINDFIPRTLRRHLGFVASQTYLVVGSDQMLSIESHLADESNRAVCVLRPGSLDAVQERLEIPWVAKAIAENRYLITEREDMETDISSTDIRQMMTAS